MRPVVNWAPFRLWATCTGFASTLRSRQETGRSTSTPTNPTHSKSQVESGMFIYYKSLLYKCQKWFRFNEFLPCMCISCKSVFTVNACFSRPEYNYLYLWLCGKLCWTSPRLRSAQWASTRRYSTTIKQFYSFTVEGNFINLTLFCFKRFIFSKKNVLHTPPIE